MVHNTATKVAEEFQAATGFDLEDMLVMCIIGLIKGRREIMKSLTFASFVTCNIGRLLNMYQLIA